MYLCVCVGTDSKVIPSSGAPFDAYISDHFYDLSLFYGAISPKTATCIKTHFPLTQPGC